MFALLLGVTVFLLATGLVLLVFEPREARRRAIRERVARVLNEGEPSRDSDADAAAALLETQSDLSSVLSGAAQRLSFLRGIDLMLYRAGRPMTLARLLNLTFGATLGGLGIGIAMGNPALAALGSLPFLHVWRLKRKRMKAFEEQFSQALELFSRALRAGHGLGSGMQMVGDSLGDPVGTEFSLVAREISLGLDTGTAIANLQDRLDARDLAVFTTAVLVQLETGGNLAEILDNLAQMIRERVLFKGKVRALTAQSRMSANVLAVIPIAIAGVIYVFDPAYVEAFWVEPAGRVLGGVCILFVSVGYLLCRKLAVVEA